MTEVTMDSLAIATANLYRSFNVEPTEPQPDAAYGWSAVPLCDVRFSIIETGPYGTYPYKPHSLIAFDNHCYYYVESAPDRTVRDLDGNIQSMQLYGTPVGWASYEYQVMPPIPAPEVMASKPFTGATDSHGIFYQALPIHRRMYVNKNPANKYEFDKIETHMDTYRKVVAQVPYGTPVYVVMEAIHPIPPTGATYLMDAEAVGDFKHTGKVSAAIGFNKSDLSDGTAPHIGTETTSIPKPQLVNNTTSTLRIDATVGKLPGRTSTSAAKASLDTSHAGIYELLQNIKVKEIDGRHDPVEPGQGARMHILGFFTYDGQTYGKPDVGPKLGKLGYCFMVPVAALTLVEKEAHYQERVADKLAQEDALMDEPITMADKAPRSRTKKEHLLIALATIVASWHNHQTKKLKKIGDN